MSESYMSEIRIMSFNYPPKNWAQCDGAILPIVQNQALFSLLGTAFGGDGIRTFRLPDLRGRTPIGMSVSGSQFPIGASGGEATHTLTIGEIPAHVHSLSGTNVAATSKDPTGQLPANTTVTPYGPPAAPQPMAAETVQITGSNAGHDNMQPYLAVNFCISLFGIFPSRN